MIRARPGLSLPSCWFRIVIFLWVCLQVYLDSYQPGELSWEYYCRLEQELALDSYVAWFVFSKPSLFRTVPYLSGYMYFKVA